MISTIVVAVLAIALAVTAVIMLSNNKNNTTSQTSQSGTVTSNGFVPTDELIEECTYAAHDLVADSYSIVRLFVTEGLPHYDEPYGNLPEDGIYTVNSTEYNSLEDIENLVRSVYVNAEAERILTNIDGNGLAVYKNREVLVDAVYDESADAGETAEGTGESRPAYVTEQVLGIDASFTPDTSYDKDWSSCSIAVVPKSETECELTIYLDGIGATGETGTAEAESGDVLETAMVKIDGEWRLSVFAY